MDFVEVDFCFDSSKSCKWISFLRILVFVGRKSPKNPKIFFSRPSGAKLGARTPPLNFVLVPFTRETWSPDNLLFLLETKQSAPKKTPKFFSCARRARDFSRNDPKLSSRGLRAREKGARLRQTTVDAPCFGRGEMRTF